MVNLDEGKLESTPSVALLVVVIEKVAKEERVTRALGSIDSDVNIRSPGTNWWREYELCDRTGSRRLKIVP